MVSDFYRQLKYKIEDGNLTEEDIQYAKDHGFDIDEKGENDETLLHFAAERGQTQAARNLVNRGATVDARDHGDWTPCMTAARFGRTETVKVLVEELGADINAQDCDGKTACMCAAHHDDKEKETLFELVRLGADISIETFHGTTVFDFFREEDMEPKKKIIELRREYEKFHPDKPKMADDLAARYLIPQEKIAVKKLDTPKNGSEIIDRAVSADNVQGHPRS